jgi:hypothetical protein
MKKYLLLSFYSLLFFSIGFSQLPDKAKLDEYFNVLEKNNKFMGSVAVSKNGTLLYRRSVGFSDVEGNKKANEASTYRIGSISKTFTAVLVMKAVASPPSKMPIKSPFAICSATAVASTTLQTTKTSYPGIHNPNLKRQ